MRFNSTHVFSLDGKTQNIPSIMNNFLIGMQIAPTLDTLPFDCKSCRMILVIGFNSLAKQLIKFDEAIHSGAQ
jgi:hypothetical protein